jgi:hypothetical protein
MTLLHLPDFNQIKETQSFEKKEDYIHASHVYDVPDAQDIRVYYTVSIHNVKLLYFISGTLKFLLIS